VAKKKTQPCSPPSTQQAQDSNLFVFFRGVRGQQADTVQRLKAKADWPRKHTKSTKNDEDSPHRHDQITPQLPGFFRAFGVFRGKKENTALFATEHTAGPRLEPFRVFSWGSWQKTD
jgi:hypothetical protein